jgi:hypothetical protein
LKEVQVVNLLPILTTGISQEHFLLTAIFKSLVDEDKVRIGNYFLDDSALVAAWTFLLLNPDRHIAVVLETWSEDPEKIREVYESSCRRIESNAPSSGGRWHVALAVPNLKAWALIDDHIRQEYEKIHQDFATASTPEDREKIERSNCRMLALEIGEWTADHPFDLEKLKQKSRQVRELCTFIDKSLHPEPEPVLATVADWF